MPPYFSGTGPPSRPSGAILRSTSFGKVSPRSRSRAPGAISLSAKSFASLRMDCCSEVRSKSKPRVYGVPMFDDRRRPLREDELARIARAIDPRARAPRPAPTLRRLDRATYARGPSPADGMEPRLIRFEPKTPDGLWLEVAHALRSAATGVTANTLVLTHHDFWFGNTLWSDERLTGVVDWDEARIDDPAFDVAYARLDMQLTLAGDAPDRLLARYEARRGPLHAVPFWDLIAALPAFRWLDDWAAGYREVGRTELTNDVAHERFTVFVRAALGAL